MPPAAGRRKQHASPATAPQPSRQSNAVTSTRSPAMGSVKSPSIVLPPPSSPSSRLVLGSRGHKRHAPNGVRGRTNNGGRTNKKRRTEQSSGSSSSDGDGNDGEAENNNGGSANQRNGEQEAPRRYVVRPQPPPSAPPTSKASSALNTLHSYFFSSAASSSTSSSPASLVASSSRSARRSSTPPAVSSDVAAVLGAVSPHDANIARQASAMRRIARLHAQLQSDMTWDPGKREGKEEKTEADDDEDEHNEQEQQHITATPTRSFTTPRRKGRPPPLNSSLIQTPPFRLLSATAAPPRSASAHVPSNAKRTHTAPPARRSTASNSSTSSAALSPTPFHLPAAVFLRRHLPLARAERRMRAEQRRESTEHWITCDACSKWRLQQPQHQQPQPPNTTHSPPSTNPHYYCGGGSTTNHSECERLDDWIVRCVGEGRAMQLCDVGVDTVEVLVEASGKRRWELERAMERLGMEFDSTTQKIKSFSVSRGG